MGPAMKVCILVLTIAMTDSQYRQRPTFHYNIDDDYQQHSPSPQEVKTAPPQSVYGRVPKEQYANPSLPEYQKRLRESSGEYVSGTTEHRAPPADFGPVSFGSGRPEFNFEEAPPRSPSYAVKSGPAPSGGYSGAAQTPVHQREGGPPPPPYDEQSSYEQGGRGPVSFDDSPPVQDSRGQHQGGPSPAYEDRRHQFQPSPSYEETRSPHGQYQPVYDEPRSRPQQSTAPGPSYDRSFPATSPSGSYEGPGRYEVGPAPYQQPGPAPAYEGKSGGFRGEEKDASPTEIHGENPGFSRFRDFLKNIGYPRNDYHGSQSTTRGYSPSPSHSLKQEATNEPQGKVNATGGFVVVSPEFRTLYDDLDSRREPGFRPEDFLNPYVDESSGTDGSKHASPSSKSATVPVATKRVYDDFAQYPQQAPKSFSLDYYPPSSKVVPSKSVDDEDGFRPSRPPPQRQAESTEKKSHKCSKVEKKFNPSNFGDPAPYEAELGKPVMTCYHCEAEDGRFYEKCSYGTGSEPKENKYFVAHEESYDTNPKKGGSDRSRRNNQDVLTVESKPHVDQKQSETINIAYLGTDVDVTQLEDDGDFGTRIRPRRQDEDHSDNLEVDDFKEKSGDKSKPNKAKATKVKVAKPKFQKLDFNVPPEFVAFQGKEATSFEGSSPRSATQDDYIKDIFPDFKDFEESASRAAAKDKEARQKDKKAKATPRESATSKSETTSYDDSPAYQEDDFYEHPQYDEAEDYYHSVTPDRKSVEKAIEGISKKDHKNCQKVKKGDMICYQCLDEEGQQNDECMYADRNPKSHHIAYHTSKAYSSTPSKKEASPSSSKNSVKRKGSGSGGIRDEQIAAFDGSHLLDSYFEPTLFDTDDFPYYHL